MGENRGSFIITLVVMFILLLSLISIVFSLDGGRFFKVELILVILFLLIGFKLTFNIVSGDPWRGLIKFYMINWINLLVLYFAAYQFRSIVLPFLVSGIGFLLALIKMDTVDIEEYRDEPEVESSEKYVASEKGKSYHVPECDKAKRIKNQIEYNSKEEAEGEGKKACDCVE